MLLVLKQMVLLELKYLVQLVLKDMVLLELQWLGW